ncbi:MAG: site-specific integrase [bacterium]|nr:site-specific integrase [bacterium]
MSANGRRSYAHTLGTVVGALGGDLALAEFTTARVRRVLEDRWGDASAATWNNRLTALGSFRRWAQAQGWITDNPLAGIECRAQPRDGSDGTCRTQGWVGQPYRDGRVSVNENHELIKRLSLPRFRAAVGFGGSAG